MKKKPFWLMIVLDAYALICLLLLLLLLSEFARPAWQALQLLRG